MIYKCNYCNKVFKTETGFKKHQCSLMERHLQMKPMSFQLYKIMMNTMKTKLNKDDKINLIKFLKCKNIYDNFQKLVDLFVELGTPDVTEFFKFMTLNRIPIEMWASTDKYHKFMEWYINNESEMSAIVRSKEFIEQNDIDLNTIGQMQLFHHLYAGRISKKYLKSIGYDCKKLFDRGQIEDLGLLL